MSWIGVAKSWCRRAALTGMSSHGSHRCEAVSVPLAGLAEASLAGRGETGKM